MNLRYDFIIVWSTYQISFTEVFTVSKLSYLHWCSQMLDGFVCNDFLKLTQDFLNLSESYMSDINDFFE